MRTIGKVAALAALFSLAPAARAADVDLLAGGSWSIHHEWTDAEFVDVSLEPRDWHRITWQPMFTLGRLGSRDSIYGDLDHTVVIGAVGGKLVGWWRGAFFGFQSGYADGQAGAISSHGQFVSSLGWQGEHYVVMMRHISNGNLFGGRNLGETAVLVGVRF